MKTKPLGSPELPPADVDPVDLPENAFRELADDEVYRPVMNPAHDYPETTVYSVGVGLVLAVVFSAAAAYLGLKVGQVFEAAIPIAIIAVGLSGALGKKNALGQNVIIQSIGACSGVIVAGAIFTLPALFILQATYGEAITVNFLQIFLSSLLGGVLGILFFIPFRKYFVKDMHGKYPFPEATATTQVLISGESAKTGSKAQAVLLVTSSLIGGIYDYIVATFGWWADTVTTTAYAWGAELAARFKFVLSCNTGAAVLGLGYIVGLKYAFVIFAGSAFVWWVIVPLMGAYGTPDIAAMEPARIFGDYARMIGIGGIAMAGIIGIIKSSGIIGGAAKLAARELRGDKSAAARPVRWQLDISMKHLAVFSLIAVAAVFLFFWLGVIHNLWQAAIAWVVVVLISFLFTTVAANAIAIVGSNPVSGMTLMTLIIASGVFVAIGLEGPSGIVAAMVLGGVVCTALAMAGGFVTDLKIGYWLGSTPRKQETWKFVGTLASAATVGGVMLMLNEVYGFTGDTAMAAPQANAMAKVIEPMMMGSSTPWILYIVGAILALLLNWLGVPALAFCLGMFLPLQLNTPMLVGGLISWAVGRSTSDKALSKARTDRGTLIASGLIAGGALFGVFSAITIFCGVPLPTNGMELQPQLLGLAAYALLIAYIYFDARRARIK
ncbi:MAG: oligopeptide transporter, OPT family [Muribaculaceae bacterium]|nr:oligopeptide transporter, OPT family [Muribaculaceae bacterium]